MYKFLTKVIPILYNWQLINDSAKIVSCIKK
jgi:hypothetical protein